MAVEIRLLEPGEHRAFVESLALPFHEPVTDELVEAEELVHETDRCWVAVDGGRMVGNAAALTRNVTLPGQPGAPCPVAALAAITSVGVHPTHRRRGILRRLMAAMVEQARERGEPLAGLLASEAGIYGRFGFGVATHEAVVALDPLTARFERPPAPLELALMGGDEAGKALPRLFEDLRRRRPGEVDRRPGDWASRFRDLRGGGEPPVTYAVGDRGYVAYRVRKAPARLFHRGAVEVVDLLGADAEAEAALWSFLLGIDLVTGIRARKRPTDDPLPWRLADPRAWRVEDVVDHLWLRVLDLPATVSGRRYHAAGRLVVQVAPADDGLADPVCGRWHLELGPDGGESRPARAGQPTDLVVGLADLGSLCLGGVRPSTLAAAGRITEERAGAVREADRLLASPVTPANSTGF